MTDTSYAGLLINDAEGVLSITDGSVKSTCRAGGVVYPFSYKNESAIVPVLSEGATVLAGDTANEAALIKNVDSYEWNKKFVEVNYDLEALENAYTVKFYNSTSATITFYDVPVYLVNATANGYFNKVENDAVTESTSAPYTYLTTEGANEDNYNVKLIWKKGDAAPTLYMKGMNLDYYNEELELWRSDIATRT